MTRGEVALSLAATRTAQERLTRQRLARRRPAPTKESIRRAVTRAGLRTT
jgi:hypothetical protein